MPSMNREFLLRYQYYYPLIAREFEQRGLKSLWGCAIAAAESAFRADAINLQGGDGDRGGSWGIMQMSHKTALLLGFAGDPVQLLSPELCVSLAAQLCEDNMQRCFQNMDGTLAECASLYNSGKRVHAAPPSTLAYIDIVTDFARQFETTV